MHARQVVAGTVGLLNPAMNSEAMVFPRAPGLTSREGNVDSGSTHVWLLRQDEVQPRQSSHRGGW